MNYHASAEYLAAHGPESFDADLAIETGADKLSCFWYVTEHSARAISFKFEFDSPALVSSSAYGSDEIRTDITNLAIFKSATSGKGVNPGSFPDGVPQAAYQLPPLIADAETAEAVAENVDLATKITTWLAGANAAMSAVAGAAM